MPFSWSAMDPDEEYEYTHDWANRLLVDGDDVGDEMLPTNHPDATKRPKLELVAGTIEIVDVVAVPGTAKLQYWLKAGVAGKVKLTGTIWTVQGRKYQETFNLTVKER